MSHTRSYTFSHSILQLYQYVTVLVDEMQKTFAKKIRKMIKEIIWQKHLDFVGFDFETAMPPADRMTSIEKTPDLGTKWGAQRHLVDLIQILF